MTAFEDFCRDFAERAADSPLKIETDPENEIAKVFGQRITALARAKNGLADIAELADATAEHHPYWLLLSSCAEIAGRVLDRWEGELTPDDVSGMEWSARNIGGALGRISGSAGSEPDRRA